MDHYWESVVEMSKAGHIDKVTICNTYDALVCMLDWWPASQRGKEHSRALRMCELSLKGLRLTRSAQKAFMAAVRAADFTFHALPCAAVGQSQIT